MLQTFNIEKELHKRFKNWCKKNNVTMTEKLLECVKLIINDIKNK